LPLLVEHFLAQLAGVLQPSGVSDDFWQELARRDWPGNIRELKHAVEHAAVLARGGLLRINHLPPAETVVPAVISSSDQRIIDAVSRWAQSRLDTPIHQSGDLRRKLLELVELSLFREVLAVTQQNRTAAAKLLGLDRATLRTRLRQLFGEDSDRS